MNFMVLKYVASLWFIIYPLARTCDFYGLSLYLTYDLKPMIYAFVGLA